MKVAHDFETISRDPDASPGCDVHHVCAPELENLLRCGASRHQRCQCCIEGFVKLLALLVHGKCCVAKLKHPDEHARHKRCGRSFVRHFLHDVFRLNLANDHVGLLAKTLHHELEIGLSDGQD